MTDEEIIKALERCLQHRECCYCNSLEECGSKRILTTSVLDLINRQKAEIESLESRIFALNDTNKMLIDSQEIYWKNKVKELAERLKEKFGIADCIVTIDNNDIDNLVKEMTESKNDFKEGEYA